MDKTSPFCSTKLVSQPHWAYNYYFLKDEPSSYRQKSPLLSELEFDVLTTVFVPRLRGKSSAGGGKRDLIIELHCDFAHIAGCCNQVTSVSDFLPSPPSSSSFSFSRFFFFSSFFPPPFFFSVVQISCLCLGVAETSCYLPSLKMLIKGTTFPKNLGSSLPKEGKGARLGQKPPGLCRALASCRPPAPFPSHHQNKGRHLYLYNFLKYIFIFLCFYIYIHIYLPPPCSPPNSFTSRIPSIN